MVHYFTLNHRTPFAWSSCQGATTDSHKWWDVVFHWEPHCRCRDGKEIWTIWNTTSKRYCNNLRFKNLFFFPSPHLYIFQFRKITILFHGKKKLLRERVSWIVFLWIFTRSLSAIHSVKVSNFSFPSSYKNMFYYLLINEKDQCEEWYSYKMKLV